MKVAALCLVVLVALLIGCSTTYYSTVFRVEGTRPKPQDELTSAPKDVIDGPIGHHLGWDWLARAVSSYETNDPSRLSRNSYSFTLQAVAKELPTSSPVVDSISIDFLPVGVTRALPVTVRVVDSVSFDDETRVIFRFGSLDIPAEIDTLLIEFIARDSAAGSEAVSYRMVRYKATFEKFGFRARD